MTITCLHSSECLVPGRVREMLPDNLAVLNQGEVLDLAGLLEKSTVFVSEKNNSGFRPFLGMLRAGQERVAVRGSTSGGLVKCWLDFENGQKIQLVMMSQEIKNKLDERADGVLNTFEEQVGEVSESKMVGRIADDWGNHLRPLAEAMDAVEGGEPVVMLMAKNFSTAKYDLAMLEPEGFLQRSAVKTVLKLLWPHLNLEMNAWGDFVDSSQRTGGEEWSGRRDLVVL